MKNTNNNTGAEGNVLLFTVDGKEYKSFEQYITGAQIRHITGAPDDSSESKLFLSVKHPWIDELIQNDKEVDLAREEIEHFYFKNILLLVVNGKKYEWTKEYITGAEIKKLGHVPECDELFLAIRKPWPDEPVPDDKEINLARPGIEHFYSTEKCEVKLTIQTPKGAWTDTFKLDLTVEALIAAVIAHFGFATDGNYQLKLKGTTDHLEKSRTLKSYQLCDGQVLVFTDLGKGA
ncbi:multiubiquitin domain-containing protein [Mucilaginibacter sp.]|uniref:multiubiquitin domain-containing protein n=1 Tax=Mucilaginibacter sp. TaxID=1882438 RepID=UPI00261FBC0D|nr:multiubiquitin domain-containing protein [Mucilaginibacter sp.]MDB4921210.1 multiubiquitin [Mucilaginibacter sp.]